MGEVERRDWDEEVADFGSRVTPDKNELWGLFRQNLGIMACREMVDIMFYSIRGTSI